jgi:hypothetical protein
MIGPNSPVLLRRRSLPWIAAVALIASSLFALRIMVGGDIFAQNVGWPTPPPGPQFRPPAAEQVEAPITSVVRPLDGEVQVVRPSWPGATPLIPPIPSVSLTFSGAATDGPPVTLRVDAGTFDEVVQLRVTPASTESAIVSNGRALWVFKLEAFDRSGNRLDAAIQRPLKLTAPGGSFVAAGIPGQQAIFAMLDDERITPIVTAFGTENELLTARLVKVGTVVLLKVGP